MTLRTMRPRAPAEAAAGRGADAAAGAADRGRRQPATTGPQRRPVPTAPRRRSARAAPRADAPARADADRGS